MPGRGKCAETSLLIRAEGSRAKRSGRNRFPIPLAQIIKGNKKGELRKSRKVRMPSKHSGSTYHPRTAITLPVPPNSAVTLLRLLPLPWRMRSQEKNCFQQFYSCRGMSKHATCRGPPTLQDPCPHRTVSELRVFSNLLHLTPAAVRTEGFCFQGRNNSFLGLFQLQLVILQHIPHAH